MKQIIDNLLSIEQRRGFVMAVIAALVATVLSLSGVIVWLYKDKEKTSTVIEARERACLQEMNYLHQKYGQEIQRIMERQLELREQIEQLPTRKKTKK